MIELGANQTVIELGDGHVTSHLFIGKDGFTMAFLEHDDERYGFHKRQEPTRPLGEYQVVMRFKSVEAMQTMIQTLAYGIMTADNGGEEVDLGDD